MGKTDCILITPGWPKYWVSMLNDLPIAKTVTIDPEKVVTGGQRTQESLFYYITEKNELIVVVCPWL